MNITVLLLALGVALLISIPALLRLRRSGLLTLADVMLPIAPPVMVVIGIQFFNQPAHVGFAFMFYPAAVTCLGVVLLYTRAFLLSHLNASRAGLSTWILIVSCVIGVLLGATVAPWYE